MRHLLLISILFYLLLINAGMQAQEAVASPKKENAPELKKAARNLEKSLIENNDLKIAGNYELLAREFSDKEDFAKTEEYLFKALNIYAKNQNTALKSRVIRNIARTQESQKKLRAAAQNYKAAEESATDATSKTLNSNDYFRLKNYNNRQVADKYLNANIALLKKGKMSGETADTYIQLAELNLKYTDTLAALEKYSEASLYANSIPGKAIRIENEKAQLLVAQKKYEDAVAAVKNTLYIAEKIKDYDTQITQLNYLSGIYFKMENADEAVKNLKKSHKIAASHGKTFEARESLMLLNEYYKSIGDNKASAELYDQFLQNLDRIILSDTSLTDAKTFKVTEERIRRLENEKMLKDELINKKNTFNYLLLGAMVLLLLFFAFIVKAMYSIKAKNKEIALQSLRREMNPHFLFNSLNSVNQFIAQNNELEANKFLTSYSNLMRNTMENSNKDFVTLANEVENLTKYLELEHLRFKDKFDFRITVDEKLDPDNIYVPNMIIQPHLENAIWHGLRYLEDKGILNLNFKLEGKNMIITIEDNGIGLTKSSQLKTHNQKAHESRGLTNTKERMELLDELHKTKMSFTISEKESPATGTIVKIIVPIIHKP